MLSFAPISFFFLTQLFCFCFVCCPQCFTVNFTLNLPKYFTYWVFISLLVNNSSCNCLLFILSNSWTQRVIFFHVVVICFRVNFHINSIKCRLLLASKFASIFISSITVTFFWLMIRFLEFLICTIAVISRHMLLWNNIKNV